MELPKTPNLTMVDDLLCPPGRLTRPSKIAIILRGPPGSGKSYVAKLIKVIIVIFKIIVYVFKDFDVLIAISSSQDKEVAQGGCAPRMLSIDDYFLVEKDLKPGDVKKDGGDVRIFCL